MSQSQSDPWPYAKAAMTRGEWEQHQRQLDRASEVLHEQATRLGWKVERPLEYPSVRIICRISVVTWSAGFTLHAEEIGQANARYELSAGVTIRVPFVVTRRVWFTRLATITAMDLQNQGRVREVVASAVALLQEQTGARRI